MIKMFMIMAIIIVSEQIKSLVLVNALLEFVKFLNNSLYSSEQLVLYHTNSSVLVI